MTNLENLVRSCATCGVLHSTGYRCARERIAYRVNLRSGLDGAITGVVIPPLMAKGTK